jgi:hypothetical protein
MTNKILLQKLEHYQIEDFVDLIQSMYQKMPEVDLFLSLKLGIVTEIQLLTSYKTKLDKELSVKSTRSYKPKISKAKNVIREFKKYNSNINNLFNLQYYFALSLVENILEKQDDVYIPETLKNSAKIILKTFEKDLAKAKLLIDFDTLLIHKLISKMNN